MLLTTPQPPTPSAELSPALAWTPQERARFDAYMSSTDPLWELARSNDRPTGMMPEHRGIGHNSGARPSPKMAEAATIFEQFEAIVDCLDYTAEQKCILVKLRCRVDGKTLAGAIASNEGLMRAASLKDPRALRAEIRALQGKARDLPEERDAQGRPINDPIDESRATIVLEERRGKARVIAFSPERLHSIVSAYQQYREQKRGAGRPPASGACAAGKPPAHHAGGLGGKPPAPDAPPLSGKPPASDAPRSYPYIQ